MEPAALLQFTFHFDGAVHHVNNILGNRHPQTSSGDMLDFRRLISCKGIKNLFLEFL